MSNKSLTKGMAIVFAANIINLVLSLVRNFILPKYLTIPVYADIKTYQLYISYAGLIAMGYVDGMYLKYGGKDIATIDVNRFKLNLSTFRVFQFAIMIILVIVGLFANSIIIITMAISMAFLNITDYYKCFFQAVGEFSYYSRIMNISSVLLFLVNVVCLFVFNAETSAPYLAGYTIIYAIVFIVLELYFAKKYKWGLNYFSFSASELTTTIRSGFLLMLGLLLSNFMVGMDRWFVKFVMDNVAFAQYSFAASVLGFLSYAVSPIAITLYNYFCKLDVAKEYSFIRKCILAFSSVLIACAFPVKYVMEVYLDKYIGAIPVLFVLFASQLIYILIKCYYINLYKASNKQNTFFVKMAIVLVAGFVLNIVCFAIMKDMIAFAIATFISGIVWLALCLMDFKEHEVSFGEVVFLMITIVVFMLCGLLLKSYIGLALYVVAELILLLFFMRPQVRYFIRFGTRTISKILHK